MQNDHVKQMPGVILVSAAFFILVCGLTLFYLATEIIAPLIVAAFFAIILSPVVKFLTKKIHLPFVISVGISVVLGCLLIVFFIGLTGYQLSHFFENWPSIESNLEKHYKTLQGWVKTTFGISYKKQKEYLQESLSEPALESLSYVGSFASVFMYAFLVPVFTFFILLYRTLLLNFIVKLVPDKNVVNMEQVLADIKSVVRNYVVGLMIQVAVVSFLTGLGYYLIGIEYFVFLGLLTGFLNLIPYIGIMIAGVISWFLALMTMAELTIFFWIFGVNFIVQIIDNNIIVPKIVGSKVSVNALASLVGVIAGGALGGIAGMFLAIPVLAVLKVILDRSPSLEPFGYLIGDNTPTSFNWAKIRLIYNRKLRDNSDQP